jgi:flavin-dependent dehydrogenase
MLLARKGYRVLVVDRATFPSDIFRNHAILQPGLLQLQKWGLLDRVIASNAPPVRKATQDMGDFPLSGSFPLAPGLDGLYAPRRKYLDKILVDAAVEAGAELREGFTVDDLLWEGGQVVGIEGHTNAGTRVRERAKIVIGADGLHSVVARRANAPVTSEYPTLTWVYYSYWGDVPMDQIVFHRRDHVAMLAFPTNDDLTCVATFGPIEGFPEYRADYEHNFYNTLDIVPSLGERVRAGKRAERWMGTADLPNLMRRPHGPGWALVGDAGYHKDPVTANGLSDAFRDAELLAEAVDAGLTGRQPLAEALAAYEEQRNAMAAPLLQMALMAATFGPLPPELLGLRAALRDNPAAIDQFFGVMALAVHPGEFYSPENMGRIMAAAAREPAFA